MSPLPARSARSATSPTPDTLSAVDAEDDLLAALAPRLEAERVRLLQLQRRIERLRMLLHDSHEALRACRAELTRTRQAAASDALTGPHLLARPVADARRLSCLLTARTP